MDAVALAQGDCLECMKWLDDGSVDLTVTSPPYDNLRTYNGNNDQWGEHVWKAVIADLYRVTADGGVVVWNVYDKTKDGAKSGTSFRQALRFVECGFLLADTMIWEKTGTSMGSNRLYHSNFEFMFVFTKGKHRTFNPIRDRKNVVVGEQKVGGGGIQADGNSRAPAKTITSAPYGKRNNIWRIAPVQERKGHPAPFPLQLATDHILSWSNPGDTVLDPFLGSGTTGVAAVQTGRRFIGIEMDAGYFTIAKERIEAAERKDL